MSTMELRLTDGKTFTTSKDSESADLTRKRVCEAIAGGLPLSFTDSDGNATVVNPVHVVYVTVTR